MKIKVTISDLGWARWYEYVVRFLFGGAVTVVAGIIAKRYGPQIGGLFLAFPAIFPATATLIEKHEKLKKQQAGKNGTLRARMAAGADAAGAAIGTIGLVVFALIVWRWIPTSSRMLVMAGATLSWFLVAVLAWECHDTLWRRSRARLVSSAHPTTERQHTCSDKKGGIR
jgi:hypothetical protein